MTITINLVAADGATGSITATLPPINAPATTESFFAATAKPTAAWASDVAVTLGMQFTVPAGTATPISATDIRWYQDVKNNAAHTALLYDMSGNVLASVNDSLSANDVWQQAALPTPIELTPGDTYTVAVFTTSGYNADANYAGFNKTNNGITVPANAGVFSYGSTPSFPTSSFQGSNYYVDIVLQPGLAGQLPPPPPPGPTPSPYVPSGYIYQVQMSDEFTAANLDTSKWWTRYAGSGGTQQNIPSNGEQQLFEESNNHVMTGSSCKLTAYAPTASKNYYSSGMLRGKWAFNLQDYNTGFYIEIKAKMPKAYGSWPAFWFAAMPEANGDAPWPPEMDVAEFMMQNPSLGGRTVTTPGMSVKYNNAGGNSGGGTGPWNGWQEASSPAPSGWSWNGGSNDYWNTPVDFSAGFHVFAIHHYPGVAGDPINGNTGQPTHHCDFYIDGVKVQDGYYDAGIGADGSSCMLELLLDHAVGGVGGLTPTPSMFPDAFEIEYVRTYLSQTDSTALVADTIGQNLMPASGG